MSDKLLCDLLNHQWLEPDTNAPYDGIRGELEGWIPEYFHHQFHAIRSRLQDYTHNDVLRFLADTRSMWESRDIAYVLAVPAEIQQDIFTLDHFQQAVTLGPVDGMALLTDSNHAASTRLGEKFRDGRRPGTGGPIRKAVARSLAKDPKMKNPELWDAISKKPPRGWKFFDNRSGKYIEGPNKAEMKKGRFDTVCGQERKKLKV